VSGDPDEESSRRRVLALFVAALFALVGGGAGVSNLLGGDSDSETGVDLSVDYDVTPSDPTPTPDDGGRTPDGDGAGPPSEQPDATTESDDGSPTDPTPTDTPVRYDSTDPPSDVSATPTPSAPGDDPVTASIPPVSVASVEPGDGGTVDLSLTLSGSPASLWARGELTAVDEGGTTEAERSAGDTGPPGELQEYVQVRLWYDADGDGATDEGERVVYEGSLADLDDAGGWIPLTDGCVTPGDHTATFRWDLPTDAPNVVQTDSASFTLGIAADTADCA
jgi:hypothetical protein